MGYEKRNPWCHNNYHTQTLGHFGRCSLLALTSSTGLMKSCSEVDAESDDGLAVISCQPADTTHSSYAQRVPGWVWMLTYCKDKSMIYCKTEAGCWKIPLQSMSELFLLYFTIILFCGPLELFKCNPGRCVCPFWHCILITLWYINSPWLWCVITYPGVYPQYDPPLPIPIHHPTHPLNKLSGHIKDEAKMACTCLYVTVRESRKGRMSLSSVRLTVTSRL